MGFSLWVGSGAIGLMSVIISSGLLSQVISPQFGGDGLVCEVGRCPNMKAVCCEPESCAAVRTEYAACGCDAVLECSEVLFKGRIYFSLLITGAVLASISACGALRCCSLCAKNSRASGGSGTGVEMRTRKLVTSPAPEAETVDDGWGVFVFVRKVIVFFPSIKC